MMAEKETGYQGVRRGDLVVHGMDAFAGAIGISDSDGKCTGEYVVCNPLSQEHENRYFAHVLREMAVRGYIYVICPSVRERAPRFRFPRLQEVLLPVPPVATQRAIADYLDRKTAAIDALIANKRKLLDLLAEKRSALIADALEKLDAPRVKLAYVAELLPGYAFSSQLFSHDESDIRLVRGINVAPGCLRWNETVYWPASRTLGLDRFWLQPGDLVLGMDRPWIKEGLRLAEVTQEDCPSLLLQRVARLRPGDRLLTGFLRLTLEWARFQAHLEPDTTGVSVPHISGDQILSYRIPLPCVVDQERIVSRVAAQMTAADRVSQSVQTQLDRLQEYRQALITAAVTGQTGVGAGEDAPSAGAPREALEAMA